MTNLASMKLPVGLVAAIVAQAMGLAVWINTLQGEASNAQATAVAAQERVTELEDRLAEAETRLAILNDQQKQINAEHAQIGDSAYVRARTRSGTKRRFNIHLGR
jgi:phage shock protein A